MARVMIVLIALLVIFPAFVQARSDGAAKTADTSTATIEVKGAKCEMCVDAITGAVLDLKGVHSAVVDLDEKLATVKYDPALVSVPELEKAIAGAGYNANAVRRDKKAYERLCPCCK